ncbi:Fe-S cluster assembly protein SufD [Candidatus Pelagibacter communis]|uniref:Fe-S cluster assembly protein SufD n=1 Tax=Pelagibacter ubique TaxID=198252 RepID=UPI00094C13A5|nr:Fe-S cluster assembly protein SufD [Candidatus Pelagibacter ubique]
MENFKTDFEKALKNNNLTEKEIAFKNLNAKEFSSHGFPNRKDEDWKFSDINQIIKKEIGELNFYSEQLKKSEIDKDILLNEIEHNKLVFINGQFLQIDFNSEDKGKIEFLDNQNNIDEQLADNSLINLNNALSNKSYKLLVKKNYQIKKPLIIYHTTNNELTSQNINLKINFELEENSSLKLIDLVKDKGNKNFINIFYNFSLEKNSILKNYKIDQFENDNIRYMFNNIKQSSNSVSETFYLSKGSTFSKNEIFCDLKGEHSSAFVNGIFSLNKSKHHEIKAKINHFVENTKSYQLVKSVLEDKSRSVYQGKIYVDSKAQKTDGYQLSKAILVDETTEFNAKPELEIYADDVKCSHGSASGSLDENSIFYLMSRGLSYIEARELLINGFLVEVINQITDEPIKKLIKNLYGLKNEY